MQQAISKVIAGQTLEARRMSSNFLFQHQFDVQAVTYGALVVAILNAKAPIPLSSYHIKIFVRMQVAISSNVKSSFLLVS